MADSLQTIKEEIQAAGTAYDNKISALKTQIDTLDADIVAAKKTMAETEDGDTYATAGLKVVEDQNKRALYESMLDRLEGEYVFTQEQAHELRNRTNAVVESTDASRKTTLASTKASGLASLISGWKTEDEPLAYIYNALLGMSGCALMINRSQVLDAATAMLNAYGRIA